MPRYSGGYGKRLRVAAGMTNAVRGARIFAIYRCRQAGIRTWEI
jgi:hypothetical protein